MKTNSENVFEVICGSYQNCVSLGGDLYEKYEVACFEAATQSLEKYFNSFTNQHPDDGGLSIFCVVREKGAKEDDDFIILTHVVLANAGFHDLVVEFERASNSYLSAFNKKEK
ncbi:hypothetical protein CMI37_10665 [Candidatus Pacearchaeota archaeon]|jgi:hypothetical protein|nr:hypothetical protein [Candidatus Pacearchaeota archaeon]|tara:strand:- start:3690 stop:4028 length:339 start_codon:yes stop_codon:yes gene_type:complete